MSLLPNSVICGIVSVFDTTALSDSYCTVTAFPERLSVHEGLSTIVYLPSASGVNWQMSVPLSNSEPSGAVRVIFPTASPSVAMPLSAGSEKFRRV